MQRLESEFVALSEGQPVESCIAASALATLTGHIDETAAAQVGVKTACVE
jgi:hypothetical protein